MNSGTRKVLKGIKKYPGAGQKELPDSTISKDLSSILRTIKASGLEAVCKRLEESKQLGQEAKCRMLVFNSKRLMATRAAGYIYIYIY